MNILKTYILLFVIVLTSAIAYALPPKHEVRAVWLTTIGGIDWPHSYAQSARSIDKQKQELIAILDQLKRANINTVLLQTRIRGTVIYPSALEPWDGCLSGIPGKSPGYDALAFAIDECHKRGMELHAWIVTIPVGKWNKTGCRNMRSRYGSLIRKIGNEGYMNPERRETGEYLARLCKEVADNYDIDGIHLDYIRYPETWNVTVSRERGRAYITDIVRRIADAVKAQKPWIKMSCSPVGKYDDLTRYWSHGWNANTKVMQDAQGWLRMGLMDELFPMMYFKDNQFFPFALDWQENSYGRIIAPGLGIYFMSPQEKDWSLDIITREMQVLRQQQMGHAFFRSKFFTDDTKGIYRYTADEFNTYPALIPAMTWTYNKQPIAVKELNVQHGNSYDILTWSGAEDLSGAPYLLYNIYASDGQVDINDARQLIATRYQKTTISIPVKNRTLNYAVTAVDRYGNESKPIYSDTHVQQYAKSMLHHDGITLRIPLQRNISDATLVTIESLTGQIIAVKIIKNNTIDIRDIPQGTYMLKTLERKKRKEVTHRLGYFIIKR